MTRTVIEPASVDTVTSGVDGHVSSTLPDVGHLRLDDLMGMDNPNLIDSLRKIIEAEDSGAHEIVAGFQSAI